MVRQTYNLSKWKRKDPDFVASLVYILRQFLVRLFSTIKKTKIEIDYFVSQSSTA